MKNDWNANYLKTKCFYMQMAKQANIYTEIVSIFIFGRNYILISWINSNDILR